jgi:hypothetical protein
MLILEMPEEQRSVVLFVNCDMSFSINKKFDLGSNTRHAFLRANQTVVQGDY